jgi:hypothetical protein
MNNYFKLFHVDSKLAGKANQVQLWLGLSFVITSSLTLDRKICRDYLSTSEKTLPAILKLFSTQLNILVFQNGFPWPEGCGHHD